MTRPASLFYREGGRVRALPLQYMKITAAMQLMRKAEEEMGQRFCLRGQARMGRSFSGVVSLSPYS